MGNSIIDSAASLFGTVFGTAFNKDKGMRFIENNMARIVFYSSAIEGNMLNQTSALILINDDLAIRGGRLADYLELLNHKKAYRKISAIGDNKVSPNDIVQTHEILFEGIFNNLYAGPRRSMTSVEDYMTGSASGVMPGINDSITLLNSDALGPKGVFYNAVDFHLKFIDLHPFEDGNGRVVRIFMNWYLLRNGIIPFFITADKKKDYFYSLAPFHFSMKNGMFASFVLYAMLKSSGTDINEFCLKNEKDKGSRGVLDCLKIFDGTMKQDSLEKEISFFYDSGDEEQRVLAAWMAGYSKKPVKELYGAIESGNSNIVSTAILAMLKRADENSDNAFKDLEKYTNRIKDMALNNKTEMLQKLIAISVLGKMWVLDDNAVIEILRDSNVRVAAHVFNVIRYSKENKVDYNLLKEYLKNGDLDIRLNAYIAFLSKAPVEELEVLVADLHKEREEVKDEAIKWLSKLKIKENGRDKRLINIDAVATKLAAEAENDDRIKRLLLGHLSSIGEVNPMYMKMLEGVAASTKATAIEKAYAIYIIGMSRGHEYLHSKINVKISKDNDPEVNIAIFLSDLAGKDMEKETLGALDLKNDSLNLVQVASIAKEIKKDNFGKDFLLLCRKNFRSWSNA